FPSRRWPWLAWPPGRCSCAATAELRGKDRDRMGRTRIVHIINSFEFGGAEAMLVNLLLRCDRTRYEPFVVSLIDDLSVAQPIIDAGIPLAVMHMRPNRP